VRILIADDSAIARRVLETTLKKWGYEVVSACDGTEAWDILQREDAPKMAILDWSMPGLDGIEVCRKARSHGPDDYVYVILLTARDEKEDMIRGMEAGADDYVVKPFDPHELKVRVRAGRRIIELQEQLVSMREALREQATHDPLTGAWNRAGIIDILEREFARLKREGGAVGVVMADLDHFKRINDTYGHMAGDTVLRECVRRMTLAMRPYDQMGRYGGEEFLIVLPGCGESNAASVAERLRRCVADDPIDTSEGMISITLSLGAASTLKARAPEAEALIRAADAALYRAKEMGRNRVVQAADDDYASHEAFAVSGGRP